MRRREFITLLGGSAAAAWPLVARAQQSPAPRRIGLIGNLPLPPIQRFRQRLQQLGYVEEKISSSNTATEKAGTTDLLRLRQIAESMAANAIPAVYPFREYADVGGLFIYGANISVLFERAAEYLDRLLKGEKPGNLPVQQATTFELIINLKAAAGLGLAIPPNVLIRADEVIE